MNQLSMRVAFAAALAVGISGCVVTTSDGVGGGGDGGAGVGGSSSSSTATATSTNASSSANVGGAGGGVACVGCAEGITFADTVVCEGPSADLLNALSTCTCEGACAEACASDCASGDISSPDCTACVADTAAGCGVEYGACSNDA